MPLLEIDRRKNIPQNAISSKQEINPFSYPPVGGFEDVLLRSITYKDNEEEVSSMDTIPSDLPDAIKHIREEIRNRSPTRK
ncbi:MAG: hypothetical protein KatS3mg089_0685 [Patescibacteria group bacterium]|nr:MAG: hypothetical protein KatS3mg089_0685 [Patescibacteria group bacterium]